MRRSVIIGTGSYLPDRILTNHQLSEFVDTSDTWIVERTGIRQRHIAADGQLTSDLAVEASRACLKAAGVGVEQLDMLIVATTTPDHTFPACATAVQRKMGAVHAAAFDIQAVCAGFVYALSIADSFIRTGQVAKVLVIGAETFSRLLDWKDRTTCVLFGDGAGAVLLQAEEGIGSVEDRGILATSVGSDGRYYDALYVDGGPSSSGRTGHVRMNGREVFRHAVTALADASIKVLNDAGLKPTDIDWLVPHQANKRILQAVARRLDLDESRVIMTVDRHANTSAASIPLALADAAQAGRLARNQLLVTNGMGGGFAWGAALIRW